jgi:hypothetical protein
MKALMLLSILTCLIGFPISALGQPKPVVIHPSIGDTVDVYENERYGLFPAVEGFQWAVYLVHHDSLLYAIVGTLRGGVMSQTAFPGTHYRVEELRDHIQKVNEDARGAWVTLVCRDSRTIEGELLSARDTALVITTKEDESEDFLLDHPEVLVTVTYQDVKRMIIRGQSRVGAGMGKGFLIGAGTGALLGLASGNDQRGFPIAFSAGAKALIGGVMLGAVGFIVGTVSGIASSTSDKEIIPQSKEEPIVLRGFARYVSSEPEYLKAIH